VVKRQLVANMDRQLVFGSLLSMQQAADVDAQFLVRRIGVFPSSSSANKTNKSAESEGRVSPPSLLRQHPGRWD
jgi:hypothetical protein